ncbi:hypothetical protein AGDE_10794 [Angomonas deanei]|nr:hypothetical protein AGDE_10794 [Angomonas deanei]|eukprot:EPY27381.1 hypothetical protein AGDE_10794 [Angomonas deanei]
MFRTNHVWRAPSAPTGGTTDAQENFRQGILFDRVKDKSGRNPFSIRALTFSRMQGVVAAVGVLGTFAFFLGPWMVDEWREALGYKFIPVEPTHMPRMSPMWWENEWRKMNPVWRKGESTDNFYVPHFEFIKQQTGRDLATAEDFINSHPNKAKRVLHQASSWWRGWFRSPTSSSPPKESRPLVLVPLCGDSPIMRELAKLGYEVDAVECSSTAMKAAVERSERTLPAELFPYIHLIWEDFFSPKLWDTTLKGKKYDVIYERQGITSINRDQRSDYAFLLKQALKDDGILYVEGIFRTGRVKGNKVAGPPFGISRKEIQHLFPTSQGYHVRCEEKTDAILSLSRDNKVLRRVPKELYVTPFDCVVFKENAVNLELRDKLKAESENRAELKL